MYDTVAPFVGAWIEMVNDDFSDKKYVVAPFVGAWIEMEDTAEDATEGTTSLRSSERGLKLRTKLL